MTFYELRDKLLDFNGLQDKIDTRIYPVHFPQNPTFPLIVASQISGLRPIDSDGATANVNPRWQLSIYAKKYSEAKLTAQQLRLAINSLPGDVGSSTIYMAELMSELDLWDPETSLYHVPVDIVLWHNEGV